MLPFRRYAPRPGDPDWSRLGSEARELAARIAPQLERKPRDLVRRARSFATMTWNHGANLRRARAGREDFYPLYFIWTTHRACNFRCTYCDDHRGQRYPDLPGQGTLDTAAGLRLLEVMRTRTPSVYFAGGEPTARKDLPRLTRRARDLGYYPIVVNTNGSLLHRVLADPAWRGWLADVDILVVSLDALDVATLRRLWVTDAPEDVLRNLLLVRELAGPLRFKLMVNTVIQPGLVAEARAVLDLAGDLGIWFCPVPRNAGPRVDPAVLADPEYPGLVAELLARKRAGERISGSLRMNQRLLSAAPLSCRNTLKPHVDHDGRLFWPCKAAARTPPLQVPVLDFDRLEDVWTHARARMDPTGFHGQGPGQCGGDCCWAQNYTTDEYAHGLGHPLELLRAVGNFLQA